jgi:hypothetical protein
MSFLRLYATVFSPERCPIQGFADIQSGLNIATAAQAAALYSVLPIT